MWELDILVDITIDGNQTNYNNLSSDRHRLLIIVMKKKDTDLKFISLVFQRETNESRYEALIYIPTKGSLQIVSSSFHRHIFQKIVFVPHSGDTRSYLKKGHMQE